MTRGDLATHVDRSDGLSDGMAPLVHVLSSDNEMRRDLVAMLERQGVAGRAFAGLDEVLAALPNLLPGCVLAAGEVEMADLQRDLHVHGCNFPVVAVTPAADVAAAVRAMKGGAADVVTSPVREDDLQAAIQGALALLNRSRASDTSLAVMRSRVERLTRREQQVLDGLVRGAANKAIAHELGISPRTVEVHRAKVMDKLGCRSLSQIVHLAVRLGLAGA